MGINVFPEPASSYTAGTTYGTTAARPASPTVGQTYYNGSTSTFEIWNGSIWAIINSIPSAPTSVTPTDSGSGRPYNNGRTSVAFTPATVGGAATSYLVTSSPGGYTASGSSSPIIVTGMQSNTSYTYSVIASNSLGNSSATISGAVLATTIPGVAGTPTAALAADGSGNITVSWAASASGGLTTSYVVTSSPAGFTSSSTTATSVTATGLTNGQAYTFTVVASNANGSAAASAASNSVTSLQGPTLSSYLVVGGGASCWATNPAGHGGGAVKTGSNLLLGPSWTVTVGAAGTGSVSGTAGARTAAQGGDSQMGSVTAKGGGTGGYISTQSIDNGTAGGNGGGGYHNASSGTASGGATNDNGYPGGSTSGSNTTYSYNCGGGGAGGAGSGYNPGPGVASSITGTTIYYGPGGAGGVYSTSGSAVTNGASRGQSAPTANNGGGAGAGTSSNNPVYGSAGVVVFQYPTSYRAITTIPGTLTYSVSTTILAGYYTYIFTAGTGTVTW